MKLWNQNRITRARMDAGLSVKELAEKLNVDITTVSNWESGRRQLTLERLMQLAGLLNVSAAYLLGESEGPPSTEPVSAAALPILHRTPVWTKSRGWALVNAVAGTLVFADKSEIPFAEIPEPVYTVPPAFATGPRGAGEPLDIDSILSSERVWVEPISPDPELAAELRGWYRPRERRLVENEFGNRFYLDACGAKWLAFKDCLSHAVEE
ncbi:MAG: helix-turn-helix domain-containing protein [Gracilibacteraceae bacterium]|nr:helix-turn-helix domain-containing protein [Gracilibacteraceae bacterium]